MPAAVVGREAELASIRDFVASISDEAAALVLEGDAGVGKTTLWAAGVAHAEEMEWRVLTASPAESETALSFSGIGDLLEPAVDEALAPLPDAQRKALSHALVLEEDTAASPDLHAIGVALLGALRALAEKAPALVAIDDVQWLDAASTSALAYAARRLRDERVGLLLARRISLESALTGELRRSLPANRHKVIEVDAFDPSALHYVVQEHAGIALPRPLLAEVHETSGGNPFYALEIVRTLQRRGVLVEAGEPLPVPDSLRELVRDRLHALPAETRECLLVAAALSRPSAELVEAATGIERSSGLMPAVDANVVELDGDRIRFTHPLLAAGAYDAAPPGRRTEIHARLAELVDDPEARARHLAASVSEPDETVAAALEEGARRAQTRGGQRAAALLLERARALTPAGNEQAARRRTLDAASAHHESGDTGRARLLLEEEVNLLPAGAARASVLVRLARVRSYDDDLRGASALFGQAIDEAHPGSLVQAFAREGLGGTLFRLRERLAEAVEVSARAAEAAHVHGVTSLLAESLATKALAEAALGRQEAGSTADEAYALQPACTNRPILRQPWFSVAVVRFWHDDLLGAKGAYKQMLALADEIGDESSIPYVRVMLGQIECALGRFQAAIDETTVGQAIAEQAGQRTLLGYVLAVRAVAEAHLGRVDDATKSGTKALELAQATSGVPAWIFASWALGHLALARGDPAAARGMLEPLLEHHRRETIEEPGALPFLSDCVEALIESGRLAEAEVAVEGYHAAAERLGRRRGVVSARRCRGLLVAATDLGKAVGELEAAVELSSEDGTPFEHARSLLALGTAFRRSKRKRDARDVLERSLQAFERLGTALWAERARAELSRISGRAPAPGKLTPAESRVAALVAEGKTNREVAAALFVSERTVEGHLSRVFGKLGVRSRTELAHSLASSATHEVSPSNTGGSPVSGSHSAP